MAAPPEPVALRQLAKRSFDALLGLGDESAQVAAAHVALYDRTALAVFAANLAGAFGNVDFGQARKRNVGRRDRLRDVGARAAQALKIVAGQSGVALRLAPRQGDRQLTDATDVAAQLFRHAHHKFEAPVAFEHLPRGDAAQRDLHYFLDVLNVQAVAGNGRAVDINGDHGHAGQLLDFDVRRAGHLAQFFCDLGGVLHECVQVVAVDFDGQVAADAGDEFVHAQLNGLAELVILAG